MGGFFFFFKKWGCVCHLKKKMPREFVEKKRTEGVPKRGKTGGMHMYLLLFEVLFCHFAFLLEHKKEKENPISLSVVTFARGASTLPLSLLFCSLV